MTDKNNNLFNKLTIVGGQPSRRNLPHFNNNLEKLLFKASSDEDLKEKLLNDRTSVIENSEFSLSPQDKIILTNISSSALEGMVDKFSRQRTSRRKFLKNAAATMALIATGSLMINSGCMGGRSAGIRLEDTSFPGKYTITEEGETIWHDYPIIEIYIPENAVDKSTDIAIDWLSQDNIPEIADENINTCYTHSFTPENLIFLKKINIAYAPEVKSVYYKNQDKWEKIPVEEKTKCSLIKIKKFGIYVAVI